MDLKIKEVTEEKGETVTELANTVGINWVNLSNTVNSNPTVETLNKIADALCIPITELFKRPENDTISLTCPHCGKSMTLKTE